MTTPRLLQLEEMLKDEPMDSFLNYALAHEYANTGNIHKAIELIETVIKHDQNYLGAYYQLGKYYEATERLQDAISIYKKGITIAQQQNNKKTLGELNEALLMLDEE